MSVDLYPEVVYKFEEDLSPDVSGADVERACEEIEAAFKGWGSDEARLLSAFGSMSPEMRSKVPIRYKELFGKDLRELVESECGNRDFGMALQYLSVSPLEAECLMLKKACDGLGTNERIVYSILCGRSNRDIELLRKKFFDLYTEDLGQVVTAELGGALEKLALTVMQGNEEEFDANYHTEEKMEEDSVNLYKAGQGEIGTDEAGLFKIICASPPEYLRKLNLLYADKYGYTIAKVLEKELAGQTGDAASFAIGMKLKPAETVADLIDEACRGFGTKELLLTTAMIRYQGMIAEVNQAHIEKFERTIEDRVASDTRGDYQAILLELIKNSM